MLLCEGEGEEEMMEERGKELEESREELEESREELVVGHAQFASWWSYFLHKLCSLCDNLTKLQN